MSFQITPLYTPFCRRWDGDDHSHFIAWAVRHYDETDRINYVFFDPDHPGNTIVPLLQRYRSYEYRQSLKDRFMTEFARRLYREGVAWKVLDVPFDTFARRLRRTYWGNRQSYRFRNLRDDSYARHYPRKGAHFRCRIPLTITEPKRLTETEQSRREWRERKGFWRDQSKGSGWFCGGSGKRWAKRSSNRSHRAWERQIIHHERWDEIGARKRKDFWDPWDWS